MLYRFRTQAHVFIHICTHYSSNEKQGTQKKKFPFTLFSLWFIFHQFFLLFAGGPNFVVLRTSEHIKLHDFILPLFCSQFFSFFFLKNTFIFTFPSHTHTSSFRFTLFSSSNYSKYIFLCFCFFWLRVCHSIFSSN